MSDLNQTSIIQQQRLLYPPYQYYFHQTQVNQNRQKVLNSLQQMGMEVGKLQDRPLQEILKVAEEPIKKSYSVKVVAVKDGEIGVLTKRVEMQQTKQKGGKNKKSKSEQSMQTTANNLQGGGYVITNYFYPKFLKAIKRQIDPREDEQKQKLLRWQAEQYEKFKGKVGAIFPDFDDEDTMGDPNVTSKQLVIAGLGGMKPRDRNYVLPQVKKLQMGQAKSKDVHNDAKFDTLKDPSLAFMNETKKMSYSRLLSDLVERDQDDQINSPLFINNTQTQLIQTPIRAGEVIHELDEENELSPPQMKLPQLKKLNKHEFLQADNDPYQKRLKKIQDKLY